MFNMFSIKSNRSSMYKSIFCLVEFKEFREKTIIVNEKLVKVFTNIVKIY